MIQLRKRSERLKMQANFYIKIISCRNSRLWYHDYVNETFYVYKDEFDVYWVREPSEWEPLNFVLKEDAEVIV